MRIGIIAKGKQGDIFEALENRGWTQTQGAEFLGMNQCTFGKLINMKWVPKEFSPELTIKLYELTGKTPEQLFPEWARQPDFLAMPKVSKRIINATPLMLQSVNAQSLLPGPEEACNKMEVAEMIDGVLRTLSPREEKILRRTIMDEENLEEVGKSFGVTYERVQQIRDKALRKLRHPVHSRILRDAL